MQLVNIAGRHIGPGYPVFIIGEAGVNHNGRLDLAKQLIDVAVAAKVDAVKFQTFKADRVVGASAPKAEYQLATTDARESQLEMLQHLELSPEAHQELKAYCHDQKVQFMSTPFDNGSVDLLEQLGVAVFKIGSGEVNNWPFLEYVARKGKPIILSTGMSYLGEVEGAVRVIREAGCQRLILLHCVSNYPANVAEANLRAMRTMATAFGVPVGYSDHTPGIELPLAAVALGACVVEKHFTLDRSLAGPDHRASLEPHELAAMVRGIRIVESALGRGVKEPTTSEAENRLIARRSLAAAVDVSQGTVLRPDMLTSLRPGSGISPSLQKDVVGRIAARAFRAGEVINWGDLR